MSVTRGVVQGSGTAVREAPEIDSITLHGSFACSPSSPSAARRGSGLTDGRRPKRPGRLERDRGLASNSPTNATNVSGSFTIRRREQLAAVLVERRDTRALATQVDADKIIGGPPSIRVNVRPRA
jgi:hypothetical protein